MKAVILAGGIGSRLSEETVLRPKPMVEIGGKPILWHIMNTYGAYGINEFVIALGYKQEVVKEYFLNFTPSITIYPSIWKLERRHSITATSLAGKFIWWTRGFIPRRVGVSYVYKDGSKKTRLSC